MNDLLLVGISLIVVGAILTFLSWTFNVIDEAHRRMRDEHAAAAEEAARTRSLRKERDH